MSLSAIARDKITFSSPIMGKYCEKERSVNVLSPLRFAEKAHIDGSWTDLKHKIVEIGSSLRIGYILAIVGCVFYGIELPILIGVMIITNECVNIALSEKKKHN